jgi:hypothetical protein
MLGLIVRSAAAVLRTFSLASIRRTLTVDQDDVIEMESKGKPNQ